MKHNLRVGGDNHTTEFSPFKYYLRKAKERKRYGTTDLDLAYVKELWEKQDGRCAFTGIKLETFDHRKGRQNNITLGSLDRIDSSKGYLKGNVQFISAALNLAKQDMPDSEFRQGLVQLFEAYAAQASQSANQPLIAVTTDLTHAGCGTCHPTNAPATNPSNSSMLESPSDC